MRCFFVVRSDQSSKSSASRGATLSITSYQGGYQGVAFYPHILLKSLNSET